MWAVHVDDRQCGFMNVTTAKDVDQAQICYSPVGTGISEKPVTTLVNECIIISTKICHAEKAFLHRIYLSKELYYKDYKSAKKIHFKGKREALENVVCFNKEKILIF